MSIGLGLGTYLGRAGSGRGGGPTVLHRSTFTASDGTALASYTPDVGNPFTQRSGVFTLSGNALAKTGGGNGHHYGITQTNASNVIIEDTTVLGSNRSDGIVLREGGSSAAGYWLITANATQYILYEYDGNVTFNQVAQGGALAAIGATITRKIVAVGPVITVLVNGAQVFSYPSATRNQTATLHGPRCFHPNDGWRCNDIIITAA